MNEMLFFVHQRYDNDMYFHFRVDGTHEILMCIYYFVKEKRPRCILAGITFLMMLM
jgi:hypothetical protein